MKKTISPADYIQPLNMNGLNGRMLHMPAHKKINREILLIYGHHAMLERWWGLAQNLNEYGSVTMPDLPGFGGMDSFHKIGQKPTIDNFADYLAAFIKLRYKRRRVTIVGISFGFVVATRMLQRYPELTSKIDLLVSEVGFMHRDDFLFKPRNRKVFRVLTRFFSYPPIALIIRYGWLNRFMIRVVYLKLPNGKKRYLDMDPADFETMMEFETDLWQRNDVRTHWATTSEFLNLDNCKEPIKLDVWHVASSNDHYFNNNFVEQHMRVVFQHYEKGVMKSTAHTPNILANKKEMSVMIPTGLRRLLSKVDKK